MLSKLPINFESLIRQRQVEGRRELIGLTASVPFDDRANPNANVTDLSPRLITDFLREVGSQLAGDAPTLSTEAFG
jgi:ATP-dependent DNA helicase RecG